MDPDDLELFTRSLTAVTGSCTGGQLDAALQNLGWREALDVDVRAAVSVLFELQGRTNARSSALGLLVAQALNVDDATPIVLPALGGAAQPGEAANGWVTVHGMLAAPAASDQVVVVAGGVAYTVPVAALVTRQVVGIDPEGKLLEIAGKAPADELGAINWPRAVRLARLALAGEIVGASRRMLELAREHALSRVQYGVPIASFQAVRHRLADTLIAIEMAEAGLDAAWLDEAPHHTIMAKALAGRGGRTAARNCQQVLAGIGYTQEHPFHVFFRRVMLLDELFSPARVLNRALGEAILQTKQLPPLLAL